MDAAVAALKSFRAATEYLPPGIRFSPTDQEAVVNYLQPGRGYYGGFTVVPQIDICKWEPVDLPMQFKKKSIVPSRDLDGWFLCKNDPRRNANRSTKGGFWKITGTAIPVKDSGRLIANKKFLTFYMKKKGTKVETKTNWVMHEYDLPDGNVRDFVLCHVMLKPEKTLDLMDDIMDCPSSDENLIQRTMKSLFDQDLTQATMESLQTAENHLDNSWLAEKEESTLLNETESGSTFFGYSFVETGDSSGMDFSFTSSYVDPYKYNEREQTVTWEKRQTRATKCIREASPIDEMEGFAQETKQNSSRTYTSKMESSVVNSVQKEFTKEPKPPVAKRSSRVETTSPGTASSTSQAKEVGVAAALRNDMIKKKDMGMANLKIEGGGYEKATMRHSRTASSSSSVYSSCSNCYNRECCCSSNPAAGIDFFILFVGVLFFVLFLSLFF